MTLFDAGARTMTRAVASAGAKLGGIQRVVLGHGHTDHRGSAPALGAPVLCHPDEVQDAEGSGGFRYWPDALGPADPAAPDPPPAAPLTPGTAARWRSPGRSTEGDEIAGFSVVHIPGHAPGLIGLWRESDRLALVSDCFYTIDMWGRDCPPHVPGRRLQLRHRAGARRACASWPRWSPPRRGPATPSRVTGDVRGQLERPPRNADASAWAGYGARGRGAAAGPTSEPSPSAAGAEQRLHRRRGQRADAARLADCRPRARVRAGARRATRCSREDAWQRAVELLFERLAVRWEIAGAPIERQRELLARFRAASPRSARGSARCCASTAPSTSPSSRRPEVQAARELLSPAAPGAARARCRRRRTARSPG